MTPEAKLTLNPRVSIFRHNGSVYLFDPATRTYASMKEAMLAFLTKPDTINSFDELSDNDRKELADVAKHLRSVDILIEPEFVDKINSNGMPDRSSSLNHLAIFVTTKCNLRCTYCYAQGGDSEKTIGKDIWQPAMEHFFSTLSSGFARRQSNRNLVHLAIHGGGEATVEFAILKDIVAGFCERAHAMRLQPSVSMASNGTYDDSVHKWIIDNKIGVYVSLDGPREIQNRLRPFRSGQPSYDIVVCNLLALVKAGRSVSMRATVTDEALDTMEETVELAYQLGLASVHFEPVLLSGRCFKTDIARPDAEQFAENFLRCYLQGIKYNVDVKYSGLRCFNHYHQRFCAASGLNFCVTPEGNITTCYEVLDSNDPAASEFFIGKIDSSQGTVLLDQARIERLKLRVAVNMDACKSCFLRYQCAGGCLVKSYRYSHRDLYSPDPYRCQISNRINKQLIAWAADGVIKPRDQEQTSVISINHNLI